MIIKNQVNEINCLTCGLRITSSILKCPRCNTVLIKLEGCEGSCLSCFIKNNEVCKDKN
jgi:hypothetical protein